MTIVWITDRKIALLFIVCGISSERLRELLKSAVVLGALVGGRCSGLVWEQGFRADHCGILQAVITQRRVEESWETESKELAVGLTS